MTPPLPRLKVSIKSPSTSVEIIAPADAKPSKPKLSSSADPCLVLIAAIPTVRASRKGTVKLPVVAPEASKVIAKNSLETKKARTKIIEYRIMKSFLIENPVTIRIAAIDTSNPMPRETTAINK